MERTNPKIHFILTGGTIDGLEYSKEESAPVNQQPILPDLLKQANIAVPYDLEPLMFKDSKFITAEDRELLYEKCSVSDVDRIIITHGTASMTETGEFLKDKKLNKVVILVGSMKLATKPDSDALFNLGSAVIAVQLLTPGVYITMNGKVFPAGSVRKNSEKNIFENK